MSLLFAYERKVSILKLFVKEFSFNYYTCFRICLPKIICQRKRATINTNVIGQRTQFSIN